MMTSKTLLATLGLLVGAMTAAPAAAQVPANIPAPMVIPAEPVSEPAFRLFDRFCLSSGAVVEAALAIAKAEGWPEAPPEDIGNAVAMPNLHAYLAPSLSKAGPPTTVAIADVAGGEGPTAFCVIDAGAVRLDAEVITTLVNARVGIEPRWSNGRNVWAFSGDGPFVDEGALVGDGAALREAARERRIYAITTAYSDDRQALTLMRLGE